jgi:hypothetical protein
MATMGEKYALPKGNCGWVFGVDTRKPGCVQAKTPSPGFCRTQNYVHGFPECGCSHESGQRQHNLQLGFDSEPWFMKIDCTFAAA